MLVMRSATGVPGGPADLSRGPWRTRGPVQGKKLCSGWKVDPDNATREYQICCTPEVGRRGGNYKAALCFKASRDHDPFK